MDVRQHLPARRPSETLELELCGLSYTATFSRFPDGQVAGSGATLHMYFTKSGPVWFLSDGTAVPSNIAEIVTNNPNVAGVGVSLFPHSADVSQTFRYVDSYKGENHDD
jgi:hypothetical protein